MSSLHLGFDPGLRRGAFVSAQSSIKNDVLEIESWEVIYSWNDHVLSKRSSPFEISTFLHNRILSKIEGPVISAAIEWDPSSVYWRAQRLQVVTTAFMLGYLTRGLQTMGIPSIWVTPHHLKRIFNISPSEKKDYIKRELTSPLVKSIKSTGRLPSNPDEYDALLLAILPTLRNYDPQTFTTLISVK
jgi:hypothetical protein